MKRISYILLFALVALTSRAYSIDQLAAEVALHNPQLPASMMADRTKIAEMKGENRLSDPEIEVEQLWGNKESGHKFTIGVSQSFQLPGVYSARNEAAAAFEQSVGLLKDATFLDLATQAKLAIIDYIYAGKCIAKLQEIKETYDSLAVLYSSARNRGELTVLDLSKLRIESTNIDRRIYDYRTRQVEARQTLATIGSFDFDASSYSTVLDTFTEYPVEAATSLEALKANALSVDPMLKYDIMQADGQQALLKVQKRERTPQFMLGYKYNRENGLNFNGLNFGMSLPVYSSTSQRLAIEAQRDETMMQHDVRKAEIISSIETAWKTAQYNREEYEKLYPVIHDSSYKQLLSRALEAKTITVIEYLQEMNYYTESELSLFDLTYNYATAMAKLNRYSLLNGEYKGGN